MTVRAGGSGRQVLLALHEEVMGGATLSVLRCVPALEARGWEFAFWAPRPSAVFDHLVAEGRDVDGDWRPLAFSVAALRSPPGAIRRLRATPSYLRSVRRHVRKTGPALVHANSLITIGDAAAARSAGARVVLHLHEMRVSGRKGPIAARLVHRAAHEVVAVSESSAASWTVGSSRPTIVYEGCEVPADPAPLPGGERLVVGTVGVIAKRKGIDVFLDAAELAARRGLPAEFRLVGSPTDPLDAEWGRAMLERSATLGIRHVRTADVGKELAGWDVFALASRRDPFPLSMLEAMAHGRPVIGARVDGIAEQITPDAGLLVEPESGTALADAIAAVAEMPAARRAEMGAAARRRAAEFSVERQAQALDAVYERVLGR